MIEGCREPSTRKTEPFAIVIDDEAAICELIARILAGMGLNAATFQSAPAALAALDQRRPEIIFLDVALAQSDAIEVLKQLSERSYVGIIQLMSGGRPQLLEAVQRIGARHGLALRPPLQKPFRAEAIRQAIVSAGLAPDLPPPDATMQ